MLAFQPCFADAVAVLHSMLCCACSGPLALLFHALAVSIIGISYTVGQANENISFIKNV